jgi:2-polyprenyl-6-methoxyphenol hydroxylase-like FAD-dependent oxidoreductase
MMRILIAGAGIGGMTLAALLDRRGHRTTLIERAPDFEHAGYMLGLYPLGSRVLHGLSLYERFAASSVPMDIYDVHDDRGRSIRRFSMHPITARFGPIYTTTRPDLVKLLHDGLGAAKVRFGVSVQGIEQAEDEVRVTLSDGSVEACDLLVGADGIHSQVRRRVFGEKPVHDTGWGGWVFWADAAVQQADTVMEYWGTGRFLGAYPTQRGVGVFAAAPKDGAFEAPGRGRKSRLRALFSGMGEHVDRLLDGLPDDDASLFFWSLADVRSDEWTRDRVVLLGDAALGFLPTAGVGASMAMESAAVLADELSRTDVADLPHALGLYVKRRRRRAESIQDDSRKLARMMFVRSPIVASLRNVATHFYSVEGLARDLARAFDEPL